MELSVKIEDISNKPLDFGSDPEHGLNLTKGLFLTPKGRQFNSISDPVALAEVCAVSASSSRYFGFI